MKTAKRIITVTTAIILIASTMFSTFAADSTETEIVVSDNIEQLQETTDTVQETVNIQEKIFGLSLAPNNVYMLPGETFQLEVDLMTSPPENPLHTEFIEEELTEVLVTETQEEEISKQTLECETEIQCETSSAEAEITVISEESTTAPAKSTETTTVINELEDELEIPVKQTTYSEAEEYTKFSGTVTAAQAEEYSGTLPEIIYDSELITESINQEENEILDLIWSSSDEAVAAVGYNGLIYSRELGTAIITASTRDGIFSASCEINVVEEKPKENENSIIPLAADYTVAISPSTTWSDKPRHWAVKLLANEFSVNFDIYKCDDKGNYIGSEGDISSLVNWHSSDTSVATVDIYGRVTGLKNGSATISVSAKNGANISIYNTVHITVYTPYSSSHDGMAKLWATQYKSTVADCHTDRQAGVVSPGTNLVLYGTSGNYILGSIEGQTGKYFMWASNLYDKTNGTITICKSGTTSDTRKHWDMYTTQTISLALTNGDSATWTTSDSSIAKINNYTTYTGRTATITPITEGTAYITANSGGKIDVIHVTVITRFTENGNNINKVGITKVWCNNLNAATQNALFLTEKTV